MFLFTFPREPKKKPTPVEKTTPKAGIETFKPGQELPFFPGCQANSINYLSIEGCFVNFGWDMIFPVTAFLDSEYRVIFNVEDKENTEHVLVGPVPWIGNRIILISLDNLDIPIH